MENKFDFVIRNAVQTDMDFWFYLDKHLSITEFDKKVRDKQAYVLCVNDKPVGILRYNLLWDNTPFCTLLYIDNVFQRNGYGKALMNYWENEMRLLRYKYVLVSTQADEEAQHFYRKLGYVDCGYLIISNHATELFLQKVL